MKKRLPIILLISIIFLVISSLSNLQILAQIPDLTEEDAGKYPGLSSRLIYLLETPFESDMFHTTAESHGIFLSADNRVYTTITASSEAVVPSIQIQLDELEAQNIQSYSRWIDAAIPMRHLVEASQIEGVALVEPIMRLFLSDGRPVPLDLDVRPDSREMPGSPEFSETPAMGSILSEGVKPSGALSWHQAGYTGSGIVIGLLDSFGYVDETQATGNLPPDNRINLIGPVYDDGSHGTAIAEIIYDMAPGVRFKVVTPYSPVNMAYWMNQMAQSGVDVINSAMVFFHTSPGDGTDVVSVAAQDIRQQYGTLFIQAAGNQARKNYIDFFSDPDSNGTHNFSNGGSLNWMTLEAGQSIHLYLRWDDWPTTALNYDLHLFYDDGTQRVSVASATTIQSGSQPPTEQLTYTAAQTGLYGWTVRFPAISSGVTPPATVINVTGVGMDSFEETDVNRSLLDAASSNAVLAVAALDSSAPYQRANYSSAGPSLGAGGTLDRASSNFQPRLSGYTGVSTYSWQFDSTGSSEFIGTSAATPHVTGAAALVWSAFPDFSALQVQQFMERRAEATRYTYVRGFGRLRLGAGPGDVNLDGITSPIDAIFIINRLNTQDSVADINLDGVVNTVDLRYVQEALGTP